MSRTSPRHQKLVEKQQKEMKKFRKLLAEKAPLSSLSSTDSEEEEEKSEDNKNKMYEILESHRHKKPAQSRPAVNYVKKTSLDIIELPKPEKSEKRKVTLELPKPTESISGEIIESPMFFPTPESSQSTPFTSLHATPLQNAKPEQLESIFDIPTSDSSESFTLDQVPYECAQQESKHLFLFSIVEEGRKIFLFCKLKVDSKSYITVCLCVDNPTIPVSILPKSPSTIENEIKAIIEPTPPLRWIKKKSLDGSTNDWLEVDFPASFDLRRLKQYSKISGASLTLTEAFQLKTKIKGPSWISVDCIQSPGYFFYVPLYTTPSFESIKRIEADSPSFNLASISVVQFHGSISVLSLRIYSQWNLDSFTEYEGIPNSGQNIVTYAVKSQATELLYKGVAEICQSEADLLSKLLARIEKYDIDIYIGFDTTANFSLIFSRLQMLNIPFWSKLGRFRRSEYVDSFAVAASGRLFMDLKSIFSSYFSCGDTFSSVVRQELCIGYPESFNAGEALFDNSELITLIGLSRKETGLMAKLITNKKVFLFCKSLSKISGCMWADSFGGRTKEIIEFIVLYAFTKTGFEIPPIATSEVYSHLKVPTSKIGFHRGNFYQISSPFFFSSILKDFNICFCDIKSTLMTLVIPTIIRELFSAISAQDSLISENKSCQPMKECLEFLVRSIPICLVSQRRWFSPKKLCKSLNEKANLVLNEVCKEISGTIVYFCDEFIVFESDIGRDRVSQSIRSFCEKFSSMKLEVSSVYSSVFVSDCFVGVECGQPYFSYNFSPYKSSWCHAEKDLMSRVIKALFDSKDSKSAAKDISKTVDSFFGELKDHFEIADFVVHFDESCKCEVRSLHSALIKTTKNPRLMSSINSCSDFIICKGRSAVRPTEVKENADIDIEFYSSKLFLPDLDSLLLELDKDVFSQFKGQLKRVAAFHCHRCGKEVDFIAGDNSFVCNFCGNCENWKYVFNELVACIQKDFREFSEPKVKCSMFLCSKHCGGVSMSESAFMHQSEFCPGSFCKGKEVILRSQNSLLDRLRKLSSDIVYGKGNYGEEFDQFSYPFLLYLRRVISVLADM